LTAGSKNGRFAEGQQFEREASEGLDRVMGRSNPIALNYKGNLASTLNEIGNSPEAELLYREILSIANESLPVNYPPLSNWKSGLGTSLRDQGRLDEAEPYIIDALTSRRELLGEQHPETMMSKISLAQLRVAQNRYEDAIKLLESIENDGQSVLVGPRALSYGMLLMTMGHARLKIGEFSESERNLLKAEEVLSRVPIARGRRLRQSIETIIDLYLTWDATEDTEAHVEDVEYWKVQLHEVEQTSERHRPQIEKQ
jgi:tetratricopeptide (TPR) repeat protein